MQCSSTGDCDSHHPIDTSCFIIFQKLYYCVDFYQSGHRVGGVPRSRDQLVVRSDHHD